ncbi:hypothetical protein BDR03DRAFT_986357 [Suillus americanus]|nr:hypothetical protein BDR03DRAFT_986357 [Suillus americanus]
MSAKTNAFVICLSMRSASVVKHRTNELTPPRRTTVPWKHCTTLWPLTKRPRLQNFHTSQSSIDNESHQEIAQDKRPLNKGEKSLKGHNDLIIRAIVKEKFQRIDHANFYDPTCASLTRNWLLKELHLCQLDYKCCVDLVLEPEDSTDEDSEGEVEGLADEREDDTKANKDKSGPTDHEDTKEEDTKTDEQESLHYEDKKDGLAKTDEEGGTTHYEDEKEDDPKTDESNPTHFEDEKDDDPKTDDGQGDASHYKDEKDDDSKTDKHEAITNNHHEDTKENEDDNYTSHDDEDGTSVFGDADNEFEVKYDVEEVVVIISICSDNPVSFQAQPAQVQMDVMMMLLGQPPQ